nr:MCE family protein [Desulfobacterales bacterium]
MKLDFSKKERLVGAFMAGVIILLFVTTVMIGKGKDWFKSYVRYYTIFDESYNLSQNAVVKLYKTDIGKVTKITLVGDKVKVEMAILEEYASRIRTDSVATVESPTFIGSEYVSIKPGSKEAPPIPEGGLIPSRARKSIADLLAEFEVEKTARMAMKSIQHISEIISDLRDPKGPLYSSLNHIDKALGNIESITDDLAKGRGSIGKILKSEMLLKRIYAELDTTKAILKNIEKATNRTPEIMNEVKKSVDIINEILKNIEEGSHDVPRITKTTKHSVQKIEEEMEEINKVIQSVKKNFLIRRHLPPEKKGKAIDVGIRK